MARKGRVLQPYLPVIGKAADGFADDGRSSTELLDCFRATRSAPIHYSQKGRASMLFFIVIGSALVIAGLIWAAIRNERANRARQQITTRRLQEVVEQSLQHRINMRLRALSR